MIELTQNYEFSSPSAAAAVLLGNQTSGPSVWKDATGITLKQRRETTSDAVSKEENSSQGITNDINEPVFTDGGTEQPD